MIILFRNKKNGGIAAMPWMNLKNSAVRKGSQREKKYLSYDSVYMKFQNRKN